MFVNLFYYFLVFPYGETHTHTRTHKKETKKPWGGIITFSGENITKWDLGLGKKWQTVWEFKWFGESGRKGIQKGQSRARVTWKEDRWNWLSGETAHYRHCVNGRHNKVLFKETLFTWWCVTPEFSTVYISLLWTK